MDISIIIVNWNSCDLLEDCLSSLYLYLPSGRSEIIVVDNASSDGSLEMVRECFPDVKLIGNSKNLGFAGANNQAFQLCKGRQIVLLNPDTVVRSFALDILINFIENNPRVGGAGPCLLNPDNSLQTSCYPTPTLSRELWRLFHLDRYKPYGIYDMSSWSLDKPRKVDVLQGACLILRREALDQVGLFDEDYFVYSEEVDLCYRLKKAGWELWWVPQSKVVHHEGQSTIQVAEEMFLQLYRGKIIFFRKHYGRLAANVYKLILFLAAFSRLALTPLVYLERHPRRQQHLTLAGHYHRLLGALPGM